MTKNYLTRERQEEITQIVDNLKLTTGMDYPANGLQEIISASIPGVRIKEHTFGNPHIKGAVYRKSEQYDTPVIAVQSKQSARAKTFALAHEFGHYILPHNPKENYLIDDRNYDGSHVMQDEVEANFFAQVLLMPKNEFERLDKPFVSDTKLADYFGVTEAAIRVRRTWLERNGY